VVLMSADDKQICPLVLEKSEHCSRVSPFDDGARGVNAAFPGESNCIFMQIHPHVPANFSDEIRRSRISRDRETSVKGEIPKTETVVNFASNERARSISVRSARWDSGSSVNATTIFENIDRLGLRRIQRYRMSQLRGIAITSFW